MMGYVLGLDLGTSSLKGLLVNQSGTALSGWRVRSFLFHGARSRDVHLYCVHIVHTAKL